MATVCSFEGELEEFGCHLPVLFSMLLDCSMGTEAEFC